MWKYQRIIPVNNSLSKVPTELRLLRVKVLLTLLMTAWTVMTCKTWGTLLQHYSPQYEGMLCGCDLNSTLHLSPAYMGPSSDMRNLTAGRLNRPVLLLHCYTTYYTIHYPLPTTQRSHNPEHTVINTQYIIWRISI